MLRVMQVRVLPTFETVRRVGLPFIDVFFKSVQQKKKVKSRQPQGRPECATF